MERFEGMIKNTTCTPTKITLGFEDKEAFAYAKKVWDWVNGADSHVFTMVAGVGDCGDNKAWVPYSVSAIAYDDVHLVASLNVKTCAWKNIVNSYNFEVGSASPFPNSPSKRGDEGKGISLEHEFPLSFKVEREPIIGQLECDECKTTGMWGIVSTSEYHRYPQWCDFENRPRRRVRDSEAQSDTGKSKCSDHSRRFGCQKIRFFTPLDNFSISDFHVLGIGIRIQHRNRNRTFRKRNSLYPLERLVNQQSLQSRTLPGYRCGD